MKPGRRQFLTSATTLAVATSHTSAQSANTTVAATGAADREYWVALLTRIAKPVLESGANRSLKRDMPVEAQPGVTDRPEYTYLEAVGRTLAGLAPWLETPATRPQEESLRTQLAAAARATLDSITNPASPDYCNFERGGQPLVDAAFLGHALIRAPRELWEKLPAKTQGQVVAALEKTRGIAPGWNNWLLFAAMVETALHQAGQQPDRRPIDTAIRAHESWYKGDGVYGDGPELHWDYYNSFVIQPMLLDVVGRLQSEFPQWKAYLPKLSDRAKRYAAIQERLIAPDGTFPAIGRSIAYRTGAFQLLAQMTLRKELPEGVSPAQVRCALTAVMRRTLDAAGTFDSKGWLRIGLAGHQPGLGERYISTGSLYLCTTGFLPLGLPASDEFWTSPPAKWTSQRIWSGENLPADHALS